MRSDARSGVRVNADVLKVEVEIAADDSISLIRRIAGRGEEERSPEDGCSGHLQIAIRVEIKAQRCAYIFSAGSQQFPAAADRVDHAVRSRSAFLRPLVDVNRPLVKISRHFELRHWSVYCSSGLLAHAMLVR